MVFKERYEGLIKNEDWLANEYKKDYCFENNIIENLDILVTGHFGNTVSLKFNCQDIDPLPLYNSTNNIGYIIRFLIEFFDLEQDYSVSFKGVKNIPIRLIYDGKTPNEGRVIGMGHFMKDRFIIFEDLMKLEK